MASLLLAWAKAQLSGALADQPRPRWTPRGLIERAKGALMERERLDEQEAFTHLRRAARSSGRKLSVVAGEVARACPCHADKSGPRRPQPSSPSVALRLPQTTERAGDPPFGEGPPIWWVHHRCLDGRPRLGHTGALPGHERPDQSGQQGSSPVRYLQATGRDRPAAWLPQPTWLSRRWTPVATGLGLRHRPGTPEELGEPAQAPE